MMLEKNVRAIRSFGGRCLACDNPIQVDSSSVEVRFKVALLLASVEVKRELHIGCAKDLRNLLDIRIKEIGG